MVVTCCRKAFIQTAIWPVIFRIYPKKYALAVEALRTIRFYRMQKQSFNQTPAQVHAILIGFVTQHSRISQNRLLEAAPNRFNFLPEHPPNYPA
jgi:hypothetical protein